MRLCLSSIRRLEGRLGPPSGAFRAPQAGEWEEAGSFPPLIYSPVNTSDRCPWAADPPEYRRYHDEEWGRPVTDDGPIFEKLCLEGFQAGLSWLTILRKREAFRTAFAGFDFTAVARFGARDVKRLLGDAGIVRHRGKIESTIQNARRALELCEEA